MSNNRTLQFRCEGPFEIWLHEEIHFLMKYFSSFQRRRKQGLDLGWYTLWRFGHALPILEYQQCFDFPQYEVLWKHKKNVNLSLSIKNTFYNWLLLTCWIGFWHLWLSRLIRRIHLRFWFWRIFSASTTTTTTTFGLPFPSLDTIFLHGNWTIHLNKYIFF